MVVASGLTDHLTYAENRTGERLGSSWLSGSWAQFGSILLLDEPDKPARGPSLDKAGERLGSSWLSGSCAQFESILLLDEPDRPARAPSLDSVGERFSKTASPKEVTARLMLASSATAA